MLPRNKVTGIIFISCVCILGLAFDSYAKEITILYSGDTHAMLYPCSCPIEPAGGIARRAMLLKQLKKKYPDALVLDSGGFFAGGLLDEYTQNTDFDMERTKINLKAMDLMDYDAAAVGDDELGFGEKFFQENIGKSKVAFLSCNLKADKILPYLIKEAQGIKIGIIGLTGIQARQKAEKFEIADPKVKLSETVAELKKRKVNVIVVLSHLSEREELNVLKEVDGIDIFIAGHSRAKERLPEKLGDTVILRPSWEGRKLGRITFSLKDNKVSNYKTEELRLSDKIADDQGILAMLPRCFSDSNCKKQGLIGVCQNPGAANSSCLFSEAHKIDLFVVTTKSCVTCDTEGVIKSLKKYFPGLTVTYLDYPQSDKGKKLVEDFAISGLPVYFLDKEVEKEVRFNDMKGSMDFKDDLYLLKPQYFGYTFLIDRKRIKGKLDLFISLYDQEKKPAVLLETVRPRKADVHFLAVEKDSGFDSLKGIPEVEEYLRGVCVQKYYPKASFDYIVCRAKNITSSWWEDCLGKMEAAKIKACARGEEGRRLLKENIALSKELGIMLGPTCLTENQEISSCSAGKEGK